MNRTQELVKWTLPDYRKRHIFVVKLRLAVFLGFWAFYLYFLRDVLEQTKAITIMITICFAVSLVSFRNVIKGKWLLLSFFLDCAADLTAITTVIYLSGGPYSDYFMLYIFYVVAGGLFYSHVLAAVLALMSIVWYGIFLLLVHAALLPPLILEYGDRVPLQTHTPGHHFFFAVAGLFLTVYAVKMGSAFSQRRERQLESRNRELAALQRMSSTIKTTLSLRDVIDQVLIGVLEGLQFEAAFLLQIEKGEEQKVTLFGSYENEMVRRFEKQFGINLRRVSIPSEILSTSLMQTVLHQKIAYRRNLAEAVEGTRLLRTSTIEQIDRFFGIQRIVAVPVVVGNRVLGALIGCSKKRFVAEESMQRLEAFASQAALSLEAALLIEELRSMNQRLEKANRVKSEFLATMSHELRTPLTAIIGFSELLTEGVLGELTDEQKESVREILHNGADLLEMINSLLDMAKIESGKMQLELRPFSTLPLLSRIRKLVNSLIQKKHQEVEIVADEIPLLEGDERKLQQVILNLLSNAIKFTPEGGAIHIALRHFDSWRAIEEKTVWKKRLNGKRHHFQHGAFEFSITDTGIGIPRHELEAVFEPFHQADSSMTRSYGGTGLGLALAKQFVEMHGGLIWAETPEHRGARFVFILPYR